MPSARRLIQALGFLEQCNCSAPGCIARHAKLPERFNVHRKKLAARQSQASGTRFQLLVWQTQRSSPRLTNAAFLRCCVVRQPDIVVATSGKLASCFVTLIGFQCCVASVSSCACFAGGFGVRRAWRVTSCIRRLCRERPKPNNSFKRTSLRAAA